MIVVTGATGFIGNVLVRKLLLKKEKVRVVILPGDNLRPLEGLDVEMVQGDVTKPKSLDSAFAGADAVFHLAGLVSIRPDQDELLYEVNVKGTRNVVETSLELDVKRLIFTSSVHALKEPPKGVVIDEKCGYSPEYSRGGYDRSKAQASLEVLKGVEKGLDAVIVCPSGVMGPYDYNVSQMGQLIVNYLKGNLRAYIDGAYDFVDVRDVAQGLILACKRGKIGESYILSGEKITVDQLLLLLEKETGIKRPKRKIPFWLAKAAGKITSLYYKNRESRPLFTSYSAEVLLSNCDISSYKANHELGYSARPLSESIKDAVEWYKKNPQLMN